MAALKSPPDDNLSRTAPGGVLTHDVVIKADYTATPESNDVLEASGGPTGQILTPPETPAVTPAAQPRVSRRGGKRPGAGRKKRPPTPQDDLATFDIARHVDPKVAPPVWDAELVDRFVKAYYEGRTSMRKACQKTGVHYRAALAFRESDRDFSERLMYADQAYRDVLLEEQQKRALEDPNRPAYMIFELKSRHEQYKPATGNNTVRINIGFVDKTFGTTAALDVGTPPKALPGDVTDAEITRDA